MANVVVRNLPDEVHRALRARAAHHGRSTEAEIRRIKLGSLLASIALDAGGLTDSEAESFDKLCDKSPAEPMRFE